MARRQLDEERIFHTARKLPDPEAKADYLDQICAGDQALRERVEALLAVHEREQEFLKSVPGSAATLDQPPISEAPEQQIGRYKLLQEIGEGGFGVVYMAEQARPVRRKVALKVIKPGMDTKAVVARFEAERQALAMMDHENIARVLDGGATDSGRPYFVMELVKGVPITEYCDQNHLPTDERLKLFISVCQAVQHAHQKGIIHRDLKPSNVLVTLHDGKPVVKVIDFGVAKAINQQLTEKTLFTSYGQMIGTPQYMSPEQAEMSGLDVDTRSDIYSLGVLLYELLTGTTPLESERLRTAGYAEMQRLIREEEPPKPSTRLSTSGEKLTAIAKHRATAPEKLARSLRGELDWIVMKALEKDRSRRYGTPNSMADDISRYLHHDAVTACPPSAVYRFRKFAVRNKAAVSILTVLLLGFVVTSAAGAYALLVNRKLTNTLSELREHLIDKGIQLSITGDVDRLRALCGQARLVNVPEDWLLTLEASALYHRGDVDAAFKMLSDAKPSNISAKALLAVVYLEGRCDWIEFERRSVDLRKIQQSAKNIEDFDALFVAYVFAGFGQETSGELAAILQRNPSWMLAKAVRANELVGQVDVSGDIDSMKSALLEIEALMALYPENRFLEMRYFYSLLLALDFSRNDHPDLFAELKRKASRVSDGLKDYAPARWSRASFFDLVGERENAVRAFREAGTRERPVAMLAAVGYFYRENFVKEAWEVIESADPARPETKVAKAYLLADQPEKRAEALALYNSLRTDPLYDTWWVRALASKIPLLLGDLEKAELDCRAWIDSATEADAPHVADRLDKASIAYLAKSGRVADEYLRADKSVAGQFYACFTLGCESLAKGDRDEATRYFNRCVENSRGWQAEANWGRAFHNRLSEGDEWPRARER